MIVFSIFFLNRAEEKREHIYWFRDYFEEKRRLLEDVGALRVEKKQLEQGNA